MQDNSNLLVELLSEALGVAVGELLKDPQISEIRLNSDGRLWAFRLGEGKFLVNDAHVSAENAKRAIYAVAYSVNELCDAQKPHISAELPGTGERFQGVLPPLVTAPVIAIRKKAVKIFTLLDLESQGVVTEQASRFLVDTLKLRRNVLVVGGTDSGKTTFANALLDVISQLEERVVIIEDTQELQCNAKDVQYLRTKEGVVTLRDLVRLTMRLSPDRIVIGEVRGPEALDLLKAWNTGHGGGVSTVHASSSLQGLMRIEQLIGEAGVTPSRPMIAEAINTIVYMEKCGVKRLVKEIAEVKPIKNDQYQVNVICKLS